mgnify:FL=1|tara:strand:+ start:36 stop:347 length:312 start_codon:yes stop_codon:yes gene_type:complete
MKKIYVLLITFLFLISCAGLEEAGKVLRNEKTKTTDEFLVEKKEPLVMPPDYNKMPEPDSLKKSQVDEKDKIRKILKEDKLKAETKQNNSSNKIEQSIIDKIR